MRHTLKTEVERLQILHITDSLSYRLAAKVQRLTRLQNAIGLKASVACLESNYPKLTSTPDLLHVHSLSLLPLALPLKQQTGARLVVTCENPPAPSLFPLFNEASAILCASEHSAGKLSPFARKIRFFQYGVDLETFKPGEKQDPVKIILVGEATQATHNAIYHFCKAVQLLEDVVFIVVSDQNPGLSTATFIPWTEKLHNLLADTHIVASTGPVLPEGLACGNAAYLLGKNCFGFLTPETCAQNKLPDFSGYAGKSPCFKNIFYQLAALTHNRAYLRQLQKFGRELAEKEYCLKKTAASLAEIYKEVREQPK